jgi:uncharacterized protein (TIGR02996 family)
MVEAAFLRAIIEQPHEDAHRLVYADWLEDHGQGERAEFIRLQIERARLDADDLRVPALRKREEELLAGHKSAWLGPVEQIAALFHVAFHRGFVGYVGVYVGKLFARADELFGLAPIEHLAVFGVRREHAASLAALPHLARLSWLEVHAPGRGGDRVARPEEWLGRALASSPHLANLEGLRVDRYNLGAEGVRALLASPQARPRLHTLMLECDRLLGVHAVRALTEWAGLPMLRSLSLQQGVVDAEAARVLAGSPGVAGLAELNLNNNQVGDEGARALASSPHLANLRVLRLGYNRIRAPGVVWVASSPRLAGLRILHLEHNRFRDRGMEALAGSPDLNDLAELHVQRVGAREEAKEALRRRFGDRVKD